MKNPPISLDEIHSLRALLAQAEAREAEWKAEKAQARAEAAAMREQRDRLQEKLEDCWQIVADLKEAGFGPEREKK